MMTTIKHERQLPGPAAYNPRFTSVYYLRCKSDPTALIHAYSGEVFAREDGKPWKHPAVVVTTDSLDPGASVTHRPASAWADNDLFPYDG